MNDEAREILVQASLTGKKQVVHSLHRDGGNCALGELHEACHTSWQEAKHCADTQNRCFAELRRRFSLTREPCLCEICQSRFITEVEFIEHLNDAHELSFLDIARKA